MSNMNLLTTFTQASLNSSNPRKVSIDPRKVTSVRETVHGSVIIAYTGKTSFEVSDPYEKVVKTINEART